ncbi:MAG TPA: PhnA protein, partial [Phaeodactylibacter sp.]|nr:PhnA protein [Phaeodactylibacter sp.]
CELCSATEGLQTYEVSPKEGEDATVYICATCIEQMENPDKVDANHWRCLNDSMWSEVPAVQVLAHRMLTRLSAEGWAQDLLDMLYLDDDTLAWAKDVEEIEEKVIHKDSNGAILSAGDTVVLIKDLKVKGANFIAKRGTAVRRISLVADNAGHIEGKIDGQHIVILTEFVKKTK